jgi:hypothetical protein
MYKIVFSILSKYFRKRKPAINQNNQNLNQNYKLTNQNYNNNNNNNIYPRRNVQQGCCKII